LFTKLPIEKVLNLNLPFTVDEIEELHNNWKSNINTKEGNSLIILFDTISSLTEQLHKKSFTTQSILLSESHFEVCEEGKIDFTINDNIIDIDIISIFLTNQTPKHLYCAITNTVSFIIAEIAKKHDLAVKLCGKIFQHRDLAELTIERLEEEDLKVYF
jgi:hydrogenase maturation factor HypF (carbamoyltransferase family)